MLDPYGPLYILDIDDCENNPCNHIKSRCINTPGSYYCECLEGYEPMRGNGHSECQGKI